MHRSPFVAAAVLAMLASSRVDARPPALGILGPSTVALPACATGGNDPANIGVVRIRMPPTFDLSKLGRQVRAKKGPFDESLPETGADDADGKDNDPKPDPTKPIVVQPFHIYLLDLLSRVQYVKKAKPQYVLVRVIINDGSDYAFYDDPDGVGGTIHGVGRSPSAAAASSNVLCGSRAIRPRAPGTSKRRVASFFIDLDQMVALGPGADASFNIGIRPNGAFDTPIFIDPKVHNEG